MKIRVVNVIEEGRLGGPQIRIANIAKFSKSYFDTTIVFPFSESEDFAKLCQDSKLTFIRYRNVSISRNFASIAKYLIYFLRDTYNLYKILKRCRPSIVHNSGGSWQYKAVIAGRLAKVRVVWHLNDTSATLLNRILFTLLQKLSSGLIFASKASKDYYTPYLKDNLCSEILPAPVDTSFYVRSLSKKPTSNDVLNVGMVANINPTKGYDFLIDIANLASKKSLPVKFHALGRVFTTQEKYFSKLKSRLKELSLENFSFSSEGSSVKDFLNFIDVYICSSVSESSPVSVWEAMSMSLPIISTKVGDVPLHLKDGMGGFLLDFGDVELALEHIEFFINNKTSLETFGQVNRLTAIDALDVKKISKKYLNYYSSIQDLA